MSNISNITDGAKTQGARNVASGENQPSAFLTPVIAGNVDESAAVRKIVKVTRPVQSASSRILELDGLRGAAIFVVLLFHFVGTATGARLGSPLARFERLFSLGWAGVDLFFVLSGFLIGGILLNARMSPSYFRTFYVRRFFRIIPLYYVWTLGYIILVALAGNILASHPAAAPQPHLSILWQFLFLQNFKFGTYLGLGIAWFAATWSLAVEEQFYLISPFLVRFLSTRVLASSLSLAILAAPLIRFFVRSHMTGGYYMAYALTLCRFDSLAFGMLAAIAWRDPTVRRWLSSHSSALYGSFGALFLGVAGLWKWSTGPYDFATQTLGFTWIAMFFTTLLFIVLSQPSGLIAGVARTAWLRELGKVSYCMYIVHEAVNLFAHLLLLRAEPQFLSWPSMLVTGLAGVLTYVIAKMSWIFFENPLLRYGHKFQYAAPLEMKRNVEVGARVAGRPGIAV